MQTDDGVRPRAGLVAALCVLASLTLTGSVLLRFPFHGPVQGAPILEGLGATPSQPVIAAIGGAVAAVVAVLLLRRFGATVWPWLLLAGAVLGLTAAMPVFVPADRLGDVLRAPETTVAIGAAPVLVVVGLYAAASWLVHVASLRSAAPVIAAAVLAPLAGPFVLSVISGGSSPRSSVIAVMGLLVAVGVLAAAGCAALWRTVRAERVETLSGRAALVGVLAGLLPAVPELVMEIGWRPVQVATTTDLADPLSGVADAWALRHAGAGLLVVVAAAVLAGLLGARVLGAVFGAGLLAYGVVQPVTSLGRDFAPGVALGLFLAGCVLGAIAAMTPWRVWFAVGSAALLAALAITPVLGGSVAAPEPAGEPVGAAALVLVGVVVVTGVVAAASALRESAVLPVAIGLLAVAVQVGLYNLGAFTQHSAIAGADERPSLGLLYPIAAMALLLGGLLVLVVASERRAALPEVRPLDVGADQA